MDFYSAYAQGFARIAACTVPVQLADPAANAAAVIEQARACHDDHVAVAIFPELCLTGYSVDDLFLQDTLLVGVQEAVAEIVAASADLMSVLVVGAPVVQGNRVYNCAVVIHRGQVLGVAPKSYLPNYREFYERRWFAPGDDRELEWITVAGQDVRFGPDLIFRCLDVPGLDLHVEVCEDMWVPVPPSAEAALAGATVLANLSGSPITVARAEDRRLLVRSASARCAAAYVYAAAGQGESTTDLSWDGQTMVYECGDLLGEGERFPDGPRRTVVDVDLDRLRQERLRQGSFDDNRRTHHERTSRFRLVEWELEPPAGDIGLLRKVDRFPFVPDDPARLELDCYEAYNIQVSGLEQRLAAIGTPKAVIGVSGGLDSTHALIVACKAMDRLGRPRSDVLAFTMPGFATGARTKAYATRLSEALGVTFEELDIRPAAEQMLKDLGHPYADGEKVYDVTFENVQAGPALRLPLPARQPARRDRGRHGRPVRARARLVHLRRRRPDVALHRQRRRAEDARAAPDPLGDQPRRVRGGRQRGARGDPPAGDHPGADPDRGRQEAAGHRGLRRPLQPPGLHPRPRRTPRLPAPQDRLPRLARLAGRGGGRVAARLPRRRPRRLRPRRRARVARGLRQAVLRQPVQALGAAQRTRRSARSGR